MSFAAIDFEKETAAIAGWIRETVLHAGFANILIGVSGGIDSAVSATLAARAVGVNNVTAVMMPYGSLHKEGLTDAITLLDFLALPPSNRVTIDIQPAVDRIANEANVPAGSIRYGNIMARVRMIFLFDLAKKRDALVCGTENRTEQYLGYFTRFGDAASDIEPIRHLYKTQVREFARFLSIPKKIITKPPTAGLWQDQTDEGELGFTYADADAVLHFFFDEKLTQDAIVKKGINKATVNKIFAHVAKNDFKHHLPIVYKESTRKG